MLKKEKMTAAAAIMTAMIVATGAVGLRSQKISDKAAAEAANHTTVLEEAIIKARIEILDMETKKQEFDKRAEAAIAALPTPTPTPEPTPEPTPTQETKQVASSGTTKASRGTTSKSNSKSSKSSNSTASSSSSTGSSSTKSSSLAKGSGSYQGSGSADAVVELALQCKGAKYAWGGESPTSGFDCSGFVKYVYETAAGISLPHSASGQAHYGVAVSYDELKPGDLVFFETYSSGISHVGIYIGNNQFIHAANSKSGVKITTLGSSGYEKYKGAVRLLQ